MKAYTLRLEEQLLTAVKQVCIKEKKSMKDVIIDLLREKIRQHSNKSESLKEKKMFERAAMLGKRLSDEEVLQSIREDRNR